MTVSRRERGEGGLKAIVFLAVLGYAVMCGVKIIPKVSDDGSIQKGVEEILRFAGPQVWKLPDVKYKVTLKVKQYSIPVKDDDIEVTEDGRDFRVKFSYKREVNLIFWTWKKDVTVNQTGPRS